MCTPEKECDHLQLTMQACTCEEYIVSNRDIHNYWCVLKSLKMNECFITGNYMYSKYNGLIIIIFII